MIDVPDGGSPSAPSTGFASPRSSIFRDFGIGAQILRDIGVRKIRWLTNNPLRLVSLPGYGLEIVEWVPLSDECRRAGDAAEGRPDSRLVRMRTAIGRFLPVLLVSPARRSRARPRTRSGRP